MLSNRTSRVSRWAVPTVAAALMFASGIASAAEGWYIGAGGGQSKLKDADQALSGTSGPDDKDTAWKGFGGYQFMSPVALELGYIDFGKFHGSSPGVDRTWKAKGVNLDVVGGLPVNSNFGVFLKAGAMRWRVDNDASVLGVNSSAERDGTDFTFGVGAQYDFTRNIGARLEWERFKNVGDTSNTGRSDIDLVLASVVYRFK